jgi:hypothetical protein
MRYFWQRPFTYYLTGLFCLNLVGAIPFGIYDTADPSLGSLGPSEWTVTVLMGILSVVMLVAGITRSRRVLQWFGLIGFFMWLITAGIGVMQFISGAVEIGVGTEIALTLLPLGIALLHYGLYAMARAPRELSHQTMNYK